MEEQDDIILNFDYIDKYIDMIKSKIITITTISIFNGAENNIFLIRKNKDDNSFSYEFLSKIVEPEEIEYEDVVDNIIRLYNQSTIGKVTIIYRIYTERYNSNTSGEFRELWGDMLYIDMKTLSLTSDNITAELLSTITLGLDLTEDEVKAFGRPEEYVFKDNYDSAIMGIDLL